MKGLGVGFAVTAVLWASGCHKSRPAGNGTSGSGGAAGASSGGAVGGAGRGGATGAGAVGGGSAGGVTGSAGAVGGSGGVGGAGGAGGGVSGAGGGVGGVGGTPAMVCDGFDIPPDHVPGAGGYDTSAAGVVTDPVTGLVWQRDVTGSDAFWLGAAAHCTGLTLGGSSGWRLPNVLELSSIADLSTAGPAIDAAAFPNTPATWFMTSTAVYVNGQPTGGPSWGHTIDFQTGLTLNGMPNSGFVRCVRDGTPRRCYLAGARFAVTSSSGVDAVVDAATTLIWQRGVSPTPLDWADAAAYCASLGGGFRLPGTKELLSLVDWVDKGVAIDQSAFTGTPRAEFWTSSPLAGSTTDALTVNFYSSDSATSSHASRDTLEQVRCVH